MAPSYTPGLILLSGALALILVQGPPRPAFGDGPQANFDRAHAAARVHLRQLHERR